MNVEYLQRANELVTDLEVVIKAQEAAIKALKDSLEAYENYLQRQIENLREEREERSNEPPKLIPSI